MDAETRFLSGLIELQYGLDVERKLRKASAEISWAKGWPDNLKAFWNAEAFMWSRKVDKEKRQLIAQELAFLRQGKNLDVGCGAYSYLPSTGFDISEKMLQFNEQCYRKVRGNLEEELPFENNEFDSVTAVFVLNYIKNVQQLLLEVNRVLRGKGTFVMVLNGQKINDWQRQKEINDFSKEEWVHVLQKVGFEVEVKEKEGLWFFRAKPL